MENNHFTAEFEFKASQKMLYPYLNTPGGLAQWFADDVIVNDDKILIFFWDEEQHKARIASQRLNKYIKFEFLDQLEATTAVNGDSDSPFIEIDLDSNELTGTVFMRITDTATSEDSEELHEIWQHLTDSLKEIVGG
ncbi:START-like domain-containing protein [Catalinimonas niigatensis]|uniref:START-like domain-containing protein n=1 Tax=Catalinimonas niigatensis TaxID=1397264 RepID=UPI0026654558|nr:START-like domain-containing protein [Catalinimonas niigatensis]WPP52127.1 START-like domain-containing protein [Catalinimonas niigatensis]